MAELFAVYLEFYPFLAGGLLLPSWSSYKSGDVDAAILLLNRSGAVSYRRLRKEVSAICEVDKRIAFLDAKGVPQGSPRYNNDFLYLGQNVDLFQEVFSSVGEVRFGGA